MTASRYCLLNTIRRWPYRKLPSIEHQAISRFFDVEPFLARGWQIYSLRNEEEIDILLLALQDVKLFFNLIYRETGVTIVAHGKGFLYPVEDSEASKVLPIGIVNSSTSLDALKGRGPLEGVVGPSHTRNFIENRESSKLAKKAKAQSKRQNQFSGWQKQLRNVAEWTKGAEEKLFIALDVESYEKAHNIITEIGISIFDPQLGPNIQGTNDIYTKHYRIKENTTYRNGTFVSDAADRFDFGTSEFISIRDAPAVLAASFKESQQLRDVVLVGHDVKTDIDYIRQIGYDVRNLRNLEIIDTINLWRGIRETTDSIGLNRLCDEFEIDAWNLHNAGNDAHYTMLVLLHMASNLLSN